MNSLKEDIYNSTLGMYGYLKKQDYYKDINSYALYTDDSFMSISFAFNTNSYLEKKKNDEYYLTYKFSPAEWFSETLRNDVIIYKNIYFEKVSHLLKKMALSNYNYEEMFIDYCISALKEFKCNNEIEKNKLLLFMVSDYFDEENIINWNSQLNTSQVVSEMKIWLKSE